ncbi:MAG: aminodeoxychorismate/anthranilate synthase component II [Pseudomonadota bacterium]
MLLMIDNYDSFTYNLVQYFQELGEVVNVVRNDELSVEEVNEREPQAIIISPGPCTPNEAGISVPVIEQLSQKYPILGVCLGHQSMAQAFGGKVIRAHTVMHGKTSPVFHEGKGLFAGLSSPITVTRYHSLIVEKDSLPDCFEITAWTLTPTGEVDEIMGIRHKTLLLEGVQFHPESILTEQGHAMLKGFLNQI